MAGAAAARESVTITGHPERVAVARAFAAAVLGRQHPAVDMAVLLLGELVTNSVRHSGSGLPGQTVTVTVLSEGEVIRVEVTDRSAVTVPVLRPGDSEAVDGRGCTWWTPWRPGGELNGAATAPRPGLSFGTVDLPWSGCSPRVYLSTGWAGAQMYLLCISGRP